MKRNELVDYCENILFATKKIRDARLIAASEMIIEALKESYEGFKSKQMYAHCEMVKAAIEAATGEEML